ncbi:MAG TPA: hypothetical protein VF792_00160 [Ktedonobacterales bacterium]
MTTVTLIDAPKQRRLRLPPLWVVATLSALLMMQVSTMNNNDVAEYQCYALSFWYGAHGVVHMAANSCIAPAYALAQARFHTFPAEYGPLAMLLFLPPLLLPAAWYDIAFFFEMALIIVALAYLLERYGAQGAGYVWLVYALLGDMVPAAARFDVAPAACVIIALIAVKRQRLTIAYAAIAVGVLFKFYPLALLPLLLVESWRSRSGEPLWRGPVVFASLIVLVEGMVFAIAPSVALSPLHFMDARCVQVESLPASMGSLLAVLLHKPMTFSSAFNSTCEMTPGLASAQVLAMVMGIVGVALSLALYWRRRVSFPLASALLLGSVMVGSKVLSPQYLLWISPIVALEYGLSMAALAGWGAVCISTTLCFPLAYDGELGAPLGLPPVVTVPVIAGIRNLLLVVLGVGCFWRRLRPATGKQLVDGVA